tara:strand:+ start:126 stop:803 length:678 start_codon:yes stop_codon:yes gene_type:complete
MNKYHGKGEYQPNSKISSDLRRQTIDDTPDEQLNDWYATYYDAEFFMKCDGPEYLRNYYATKNFYRYRFDSWFEEFELDGNIHLDLGFSTGKSLFWLSQIYPNLQIHTIDFNENCRNIFEPLQELIPQIVDISIQDASKLDFAQESFDSITALDFYEHTPLEVMKKSLELNFDLLRKGGMMYLYVGKTPNEEHINLIPDAQTIALCVDIGFTFEKEKNQLLVFSK